MGFSTDVGTPSFVEALSLRKCPIPVGRSPWSKVIRRHTTPGAVMVISQLPPPYHGSTVMTTILVKTLDGLGIEREVVERRFSRDIGDIGNVAPRKLLSAISLWARVTYKILALRPSTVIFFGTTRIPSFLVDCLIVEIIRLARVPVVNYVHTVGYVRIAERGTAWRWLVRRQLSAMSATVCLAQSLRGDVAPFVPAGSIAVIPNTANAPEPPQEYLGDGDPRILFLSNLIAEKGADTFVDIALRLLETRPDLRFIVAGAIDDASYLNSLRSRVEVAGRERQIEFIGQVSGSAKWRLLSSVDVLVFPSRYIYEAQPLAILEALACGVPVVASRIGGIASTVRDGETGFLLEANDAQGFHDRLLTLMDSPEQLKRMSEAASLDARERFSLEAFTDSWNRLLNPCVSVPPAGGLS